MHHSINIVTSSRSVTDVQFFRAHPNRSSCHPPFGIDVQRASSGPLLPGDTNRRIIASQSSCSSRVPPGRASEVRARGERGPGLRPARWRPAWRRGHGEGARGSLAPASMPSSSGVQYVIPSAFACIDNSERSVRVLVSRGMSFEEHGVWRRMITACLVVLRIKFGDAGVKVPGVNTTLEALGINDDSLAAVLFGVTGAVGFAFSQWQGYQAHGCIFLFRISTIRIDLRKLQQCWSCFTSAVQHARALFIPISSKLRRTRSLLELRFDRRRTMMRTSSTPTRAGALTRITRTAIASKTPHF